MVERARKSGACLMALLMGLGIVFSGGCRAPRAESVPEKTEVPAADDLLTPSVPKAEMLDEAPIVTSDVAPDRGQGVEEQQQFPERKAPETPTPHVGKYPDNLIKGIADPDETVDVVLNFDAAPLTEVVPLFGALLNFSYLIDPGIKGAVTMTVDSEMTAREAWQMFEHVLWLAGAYASRNPGFVHILPFDKMPRERRLLMDHDPAANVEVAFIRVKHAKSGELVNLVKPFMTEGATITDLPRLNTLMLVEAPSNVPKLRELISRLDAKGESNWPHVALRCHQVAAETILEELETLFPVLGFPVASEGGPSGGQVKLAAVPRLQVVVASAAMPEVLEEVKRWVRVLDREDVSEQENIFFYNVRHSTADALSEALSVFFNTSATTRSIKKSTEKSISGKASSTPGSSARRSQSSTRSRRRTPEEGEEETIFDTPVIVYADGEQNRLTIRTTQRAYAMVHALLRRLDVAKRQVAIQAYISEIRLTESTEYGFAYAAAQKYGDYLIRHGAGHASGAFSSPVDIITSDPAGRGFTFLFENEEDDDKLAFVRAVAGEGNVRILSAPQIVAASGEEAKINVGSEVPIITGDYTDTSSTTTTTGSTFRSIEYQDTGVILTVTPYITAGNEVTLQVQQEVSSASIPEQAQGVIAESPTISKKDLSSTLVVPDGGTVLMGGLIETRAEQGHSGVPVIKDIPVFGRLFRTNAESDDRTELIVLISVNVIRGAETSNILAKRYKEALKEIERQMPR